MLSLFKYADTKDKIHLFFGVVCALAAGCSFPFFMIFFGDIVTVFFDFNRPHAAELAFEVTKKFFIIGGATWFLSTIFFKDKASSDSTAGTSLDQTKL